MIVDGIVTVGFIVFVIAAVGSGVLVSNKAPGVRKTLIHTGCVRMEGSRGSRKSLGRLVRKLLFGSMLDPILVFSFQLGEKRIAHCPARITHRNPISRIMRMMIQSRRSRSGAFSSRPILFLLFQWQADEDRCARVVHFIVAGAFEPDTSVVRFHNAA